MASPKLVERTISRFQCNRGPAVNGEHAPQRNPSRDEKGKRAARPETAERSPLCARTARSILLPYFSWVIVAGPLLAPATLRGAGEPAAANPSFFENRIRPVLVEQCYECHSATAKKLKGGLRVDSRATLLEGGNSGPALVPGDPSKSLLLRAVRHEEKDLAMPAKKPKLPDPVIADFAAWIEQGAPFATGAVVTTGQPHWAFQPVTDPARPAVTSPWPRTSVDDFILAKLQTQDAEPAPAADKRTLLRRATYDLTGLSPTADQADAFEKDSSSTAFAQVIERLLASPEYGERWGRHWLDLVRYADTAGETADYPVPEAWRYRNWVIDAFNADKPYDEFLREQIAGDILARRGPRELYAGRVTATGYLAISRRFGFDSENYHHLTIQDTIDTLGQTVLGLTLGCARCHAHKFDPVSMDEYYALYGIFESTRYAFPGSEQKQKARALVPLVPPEESQPQWRAFDARVARLGTPATLLRSVDDLDGDFEMQAPAAGGSKGVLVPPWVYGGTIAVTTAAQSPFKNLYALGKVGASVPPGTNAYHLGQALHPGWKRGGLLHANLDLRMAGTEGQARGHHRFWIGASAGSAAVEIFLFPDLISLRAGDRMEKIRSVKTNQWQNLQLTLDLEARTVSGQVGSPGDVVAFSARPFSPAWSGTIDFMGLDSHSQTNGVRAGLALDNLAVQVQPIAPVSTTLPGVGAATDTPDSAALTSQLQQLVGIDGDFESQADHAPPALPWGPGPDSAVKIEAGSQSPFRNLYPAGELGIRLPNSGAYNGFGQTLTNHWKSDRTERLFASFDFRCADARDGGGSWRFYLGRGPGKSAAIELFFNSKEFFRRSAGARDLVRPLRAGEWHQVQLVLNLKEKTYTGSIATAADRTEFSGECASGWDGGVDHTFIDSHGHLPGVKPALDADNFAVGEEALPPGSSARVPVAVTGEERGFRRSQASALRRQLAELARSVERSKQEMNALLAEGPFDLAYAVGEGTPRNSRIQLRGEPDKPGKEVPRGFLGIFGARKMPQGLSGSGRLELAEWLTQPGNPLTARVMVNRIWQHHFGQGLVKTPNDFGARGQPPTHPELLDHLAAALMKSGWSIKTMHRLIMLSATYQQSSVKTESVLGNPSPAAARSRSASLDIESRMTDYFSPFPRRRLTAEEIRDTILLVSGELNPKPGRGHPFPAPTGWGFTQHSPFSAVYDHNQRSVYLMTQRLKRHPFLALFDGADPNASTAERRTTTVPTQALYFLNDPFVHFMSEKVAARVRSLGADETQRIAAAYRLALGRIPTEVEQAEAVEFLAACRSELGAGPENLSDAAGWAALARVLFGSNEFLHVD
ncbi:MAG: DUF1553 domain-containing protein [Verrucomicrobia bacterium]|nr:DUF1553 domain-containing protein [Verrucomicrobiota bacterium]